MKSKKEALELVEKQEFVRSVRLILPSETGVLSDDYFFPLFIGWERAVIFRERVYEALFKGIREKLGTAGEVMLYYQGFSVGQKAYQNYEVAGSEETEVLIELLKVYARTLGWGIIDVVKMDVEREALLHVYGNYECETGNHAANSSEGFLPDFSREYSEGRRRLLKPNAWRKETPTVSSQ